MRDGKASREKPDIFDKFADAVQRKRPLSLGERILLDGKPLAALMREVAAEESFELIRKEPGTALVVHDEGPDDDWTEADQEVAPYAASLIWQRSGGFTP